MNSISPDGSGLFVLGLFGVSKGFQDSFGFLGFLRILGILMILRIALAPKGLLKVSMRSFGLLRALQDSFA